MTDLIRQQLRSMAVMLMCGIAVALMYQVLRQVRQVWFMAEGCPKSRLSGVLDGAAELLSLILSAWAVSVFLYYSDRGNIRLQDAVCFFAGIGLWRKVNGKEGQPAPGVREESQGAGHQFGTEKPERKKKRKG